MVEYIKLKNRDWRTLRGMDNEMMDWMKYHSIQDLRDLAFEMYNRGEDISEMVQLIHEMDSMAHATNMTNAEDIYADSEYDILSYVEECEKSYV
jgi:mevalonate pyrophosphate decarboxylase